MKDKRPYFIFGTAAILLLAFFVFFGNNEKKYNWLETYEEKNKDPYGTYILHELLKGYHPNHTLEDIQESIRHELPLSTTTPSNYVFVGEGLYLDTSNVNRLLAFVEEGNTAFISCKTIPYDLMYYIYTEECNENYWVDFGVFNDTLAQLNFLHNKLQDSSSYDYQYIYRHRARSYDWSYIDTAYFCDEIFSPIELGSINGDKINFCRFNYGKGNLYLHTTPLAFSNIRLLEKEGVAYSSKVFSHLEKGPIYWDSYSRVDADVSRRRNNMASNSGGSGLSKDGPLKYILSQTPLAWAWYLALGLTLLYLFFRTKRRQRIIPVLEANTNTSMEFISTIGSLYFMRNDHKKLAQQKMKLFLAYVRERYHLPTSQLDEEFVQKLTAHSEIPVTIINQILLFNKNIKSSTHVSEKTLIDFHVEMDKFYKNCK